MEICFVVMGFGKKTDYSDTPRTLDLDATYRHIIKPAVIAAGLDCVRADEVSHSGLIDKPMYELLLRADLVIADISTGNQNALYELGVRHALKPFSTIMMKEQQGKFPFDLSHLAAFQYRHMGEDIGATEAATKAKELEALIRAVMTKKDLDSPVFSFLHGLKGATISDHEFKTIVADVKAHSDSLSKSLEMAQEAAAKSNSAQARDHFKHANDLQLKARQDSGDHGLPDAYLIQQLALHTYKADAKSLPPRRRAALQAAQGIIDQLTPETSTDPETLGIAGAIQKRLYEETNDRKCLDFAVEFYGRGFEVKRDYYNGENYAVCLDWRAKLGSAEDAAYDRETARRVRRRVVERLERDLAQATSSERPDYPWMIATMANTLIALGKDGNEYERAFRDLNPASWQIETFEKGKAYAQQVASTLT